MTILEKNIQALLSGVNEPLGNRLLNFIQNKTCSRFSINENLNIYDKTHNVRRRNKFFLSKYFRKNS